MKKNKIINSIVKSCAVLLMVNIGTLQYAQAQNSITKNSTQALDSIIFNYKSSVQNWQTPEGISNLHIDAYGAQGGGESGGKGGRVQADIQISPGSKLSLFVGSRPGLNEVGFNGGGKACGKGFGGGGAADIRIGGNAIENRILVAGGGGGSGYGGSGGAGGGLEGGSGNSWDKNEDHIAKGGKQESGGKAARAYYSSPGKLGEGGEGLGSNGNCFNNNMGGGGGGYYGGGGSGAGGAGGGSSYTSKDFKNVKHQQGVNEGNAKIKIYWEKRPK